MPIWPRRRVCLQVDGIYFVNVFRSPGQFLMKAKSFSFVGPLLAKLAKGEHVVLQNGQIVSFTDCLVQFSHFFVTLLRLFIHCVECLLFAIDITKSDSSVLGRRLVFLGDTCNSHTIASAATCNKLQFHPLSHSNHQGLASNFQSFLLLPNLRRLRFACP